MSRVYPNLLFILILFPLISNAQDGGVSGMVYGENNQEPLPFTNVILISPSDSTLVSGGTTDINGAFEFSSNPGKFLLKVSYIGYRDFYRKVNVEAGQVSKVGYLTLQTDAKALDVVQIEALQSSFKNDIDKKVYNVENSIVAEGGTAIDVLETLPSVQVDENGGISLRGSGEVLIYINGRPTNLSGDDTESILAQFPANSVKSIELITNPSSRYDAAGAGGIINIVLKKNQKTGINGQANASVGTRNKYTTGFSMNYGGEKLNVSSTYSFQYRERYSNNTTTRQTFSGSASPFLDLDYATLSTDRNHLGRVALEYSLNEKMVIGAYGQINYENENSDRDYNQIFSNLIGARDSLITRNLFEDTERLNLEAGLSFDWTIKEGEELRFTSSYANEDRERVEYFDQLVFLGSETLFDRRELQVQGRPNFDNLIQGQLDYKKSLRENLGIEAGLRTIASLENRSQSFESFEVGSGLTTSDPQLNDSVQFDQYINAAYFQVAGKWNKLGYQAGLRAEHTSNSIKSGSMDTAVLNDYFDVFPSMYLTYDLEGETQLIANYSRRINRPGMWALAPLRNVQDPVNQRIGNPDLQPEYTDSYEAGMDRKWSSYFLTATVFHRRTTDLISRVYIQENNVNTQTRENAASENATGVEVINQIQMGNWMDATLTGNIFYTEVSGQLMDVDFVQSTFSWTMNLLANMKVGSLGTAQLQANYRGPMVRPQGTIRPIYGVNIGVRRDILKGRGSLSLNVQDVFNTRRFIVETSDANFVQTRTFDWETQIATLTFTYNFGAFRTQEERKSTNGGMNEDGL
jgi:outer membrane receptor protein involved in Fe transport